MSVRIFTRTPQRHIYPAVILKLEMTINKRTALEESPTPMETSTRLSTKPEKNQNLAQRVSPHQYKNFLASPRHKESSLHRTVLLPSKPHRCVSESQAEVHRHTLITLAVSFKELYAFFIPYGVNLAHLDM